MDGLYKLLQAKGVLPPEEPTHHDRVMAWVRSEVEAQQSAAEPVPEPEQPDSGLSAADVLRREIQHHHQHHGSDLPLNGQALLDAAAAAVNGSQSVRESIATVLHDYRRNREQQQQ
jgi:hypothetical protein